MFSILSGLAKPKVLPTTQSAMSGESPNLERRGDVLDEAETNIRPRGVERLVFTREELQSEIARQVEQALANQTALAAADRTENGNSEELQKDSERMEEDIDEEADEPRVQKPKDLPSFEEARRNASGSQGSYRNAAKLPPLPLFTGSGPNNTSANNLDLWRAALVQRQETQGLNEAELLVLAMDHLRDDPLLAHRPTPTNGTLSKDSYNSFVMVPMVSMSQMLALVLTFSMAS
jgi:hypothetical protein